MRLRGYADYRYAENILGAGKRKYMDAEKVRMILEALMAGDAMGMPTEFMSRKEIRETFGGWVSELIDTSQSKLHRDLPTGSATDDTEENLWLLRRYCTDGKLTVENTVQGLLSWIEETDAIKHHYIGPSAAKALNAVREGASPYESGKGGTTCGGMMRTPSAFLFCPEQSEEMLAENIFHCLIPTHFTSEAMEAAGAYGFALRAAYYGASFDEVIEASQRGAEMLLGKMDEIHSAPSSAARILEVCRKARALSDKELLDWMHDVLGCGLPSADVCGAVFAVFAAAGKDVFRGICLGASMGGDTDTIAALSGALCAAYCGGHNIPKAILERILNTNAYEYFAC